VNRPRGELLAWRDPILPRRGHPRPLTPPRPGIGIPERALTTVVKPRLVGINHVALQVEDLDEAVAFYTQAFAAVSFARPFPGAAFLELGDQFLALFERGSRAEEPHFGLVVDDKEAARRAIEEAGYEILPGRFLDFRDPAGNRVQLVQYDQIQFTKADRILAGMGLDLGKTDAALDELRAKGLAD